MIGLIQKSETCSIDSKINNLMALESRQMKLIKETVKENERDQLLAMWGGFLTGLLLTNAITYQEYDSSYKKLQDFSKKLGNTQGRTG